MTTWFQNLKKKNSGTSMKEYLNLNIGFSLTLSFFVTFQEIWHKFSEGKGIYLCGKFSS